MNWMTDKSEYLTTKLEYSGSSASWSAEGNLLANTVTSVPSGAVGSPWIVSYSVNGYVADHNGSLNLNYLDRDLSARVDSDGRFSVSAGNNWTKPIVIDYVIQQGNSTLASQAIITSGKLPQTPDVLPPAHYIGNNPSGIAGHAREGTETGNKLVSFTVKTADGQTASHAAGSIVDLAGGIGTLQMRADGSFEFKPKAGYTGDVPEITTTVLDANGKAFTGTLQLSQQSADSAEGSRSVLTAELQDHPGAFHFGDQYMGTGNVLTGATSTLDGKPFGKLEITEFTFEGKTYQAGETASSHTGLTEDFTILRDGSYIYFATGMGLSSHQVGYTLSNGSKSGMATLDIGIRHNNDNYAVAPDYNPSYPPFDDTVLPTFPDADENISVTGQITTGMLLEMPFAGYLDRKSELTGFSIDGKHYQFEDVAAIYGLGTFTVNRNGYFVLSLEGQQVPGTKMPDVHYTVEMNSASGTKTDTSVAHFNLANGLVTKPYAEANSKADAHAKLTQTHVLEHQMESGNLLDGYSAADKPYIAGFRVGNSYYATNQTVEIANLGLLTLNRDGSYYIDARDLPNFKRGWSIPEIAFTVSNGSKSSSSSLFLKAGDKLKNAEPTPYDDNDTLTYYGKSAHAYLLDDKSLKVTSFTLDGKTYHAGQIAKTDIGTFVIHSDGLLKVNGAAAAEKAYHYQASYTISHGGKTGTSLVDFTLDNSQNDTLKNHPAKLATLVDGDEAWQAVHNGVGSVLTNTEHTVNGKPIAGDIKVTDFVIDGVHHAPDSLVEISAGTFELKSTGQFSFVSNHTNQYYQGDIGYTVSNGEKTDSSVLRFSYDGFEYSRGSLAEGNDVSLLGSDNTGVMIGDVNQDRSSDSVLSADTLGANIGKVILLGDHLNVDQIFGHDANDQSFYGKEYINSLDAVRDSLRFDGKSYTDADMVKFIQDYRDWELYKTAPQGGNDKLTGAGGDDILIGGSGNDILTGKGGHDSFIFSGDSGHDIITDFTKGLDTIVLDGLSTGSTPQWDAASGVLSFTTSVTPAPGETPITYQNTVTIQNAAGLTLDDLLNKVPQV